MARQYRKDQVATGPTYAHVRGPSSQAGDEVAEGAHMFIQTSQAITLTRSLLSSHCTSDEGNAEIFKRPNHALLMLSLLNELSMTSD